MSHWIIYLQRDLLPTSSSKGTYQFSQLLPTVGDEMLKDIRAITELKPDRIVHIQLDVFLLCTLFIFTTISSYQDLCLLVQNCLFICKLSIQVKFKIQSHFFSLFCLQKRLMTKLSEHMHMNMITVNKYVNKKMVNIY